MAELNYQKGITLNFNLRKPTSKRPTNLYASSISHQYITHPSLLASLH